MDEEAPKPKPKSKKVFINHIDTYHSYQIAKYLSKCVSGASLEEDEEEEENEGVAADAPKEGLFEIYGTLLNDNDKNLNLDFVKTLYKFDTREELYKLLTEIDVIIYNIIDDESQLDEGEWLSKSLYDHSETISVQKQFLLLSSVMTWAKTKNLEPEEDVEIPFTEEDYRRRRPHTNFQRHLILEKNVIKRGNNKKEKLITYVVASALTYGCGENVLHYFFKQAWENANQLKVYGNGQNVIPTIHVRDLAGVFQNLIDKRPKIRYILAADDSKNTLEEIIKAISKSLSTGKIKHITKEEVLTDEEIDQNDYDQLLINLQIDSNFVKENMKIKWFSETGMVENINKIVKEYKQDRNLIPFRVCVLGPPTVGKTSLAKEITNHYRIHGVNLKYVIEETMTRLQKSAARIEQAGGDEIDEEEGGEEAMAAAAEKAEEDAALLENVNESMAENGGRMEDQYVTQFLKMRLLSKPCRNQGFVLDNFPKTKEQAESLFNVDEEEEEEEEENEDEEKPSYNKNLLPSHVFVLQADDEFLKNRILNMTEEAVTGTHNTEEGFTRRLFEYHRVNNVEDTVLNYFEDNKVEIVHFDIRKDEFKTFGRILNEVILILGKTRNYYPTAAQIANEMRNNEEKESRTLSLLSEEKRKRKLEEEMLREERRKQWNDKMEEIKMEEDKYLNEQSVPLRNYLMHHVMPVLTKGLISCVQERPENAIDHLAEYLFKNNPQYD